jgi:hypothetical protein
MSYTDQELLKFIQKVQAAGVVDSDPVTQWYEASQSFEAILSTGKILTETVRLRGLPAADLATAVANAAGNTNLIDDLSGVASAVRLTPLPGVNNTYLALSTFGDFTSARVDNWIAPAFVPRTNGLPSSGYAVRLWDGDPNVAGTEVLASDGQTGSGATARVAWFFNYAIGLIMLADDFVVADPYITGFRYIGGTLDTPGAVKVQDLVISETSTNLEIYVRTAGSDTTGSGEIGNPYRTVERALEDVPAFSRGGRQVIIDCTGIGVESQAKEWLIPPFTSQDPPQLNFAPSDPNFVFEAPLTIRAAPNVIDTITAPEIVSQVGTPGPESLLVVNTTKSYALNAQQNRFLVGSGLFQFAPIASNTAGPNSSLEVCFPTLFGTFTPPLSIVEPSAELRNTAASAVATLRGLNIQSAIQLTGLRLSAATPGFGYRSARLENVFRTNLQACYLDGLLYFGGFNIETFSLAIDSGDSLQIAGAAAAISRLAMIGAVWDNRNAGNQDAYFVTDAIFDGVGPIGSAGTISELSRTSLRVTRAIVRNGTGNGVSVLSPSSVDLRDIDIYACVGAGVLAERGAQLQLTDVRTVGGAANGSYGLRVRHGAQVEADASSDVSGVTNDIKVGRNAALSWVTFRTPALPRDEVDAAVELARLFQE